MRYIYTAGASQLRQENLHVAGTGGKGIFYNMDGARSNSCQKLVWDLNTVKDEKIYNLNSFWWLKGKNIQHFQAQVN
jgi:hypothetical protein